MHCDNKTENITKNRRVMLHTADYANEKKSDPKILEITSTV